MGPAGEAWPRFPRNRRDEGHGVTSAGAAHGKPQRHPKRVQHAPPARWQACAAGRTEAHT
eukprot:11419614-Alexandrium_andersonii.AAC.1